MFIYTIWIAALLSVVTFYVHTFIGGKRVATPLLEDQSLPLTSKWLSYYCWHVTTVLIAFMAAGFVWIAFYPHTPSLVFFGGLTLSLSVLSAFIALKAGIGPLRFPSTSLFASIAMTCATALLLQ